MPLGSLFFDLDRRLRPAWRALVFLPTYFFLLIVFSLVGRFLFGPDALQLNSELTFTVGGLAGCLVALLTARFLLRWLDRRDFHLALGYLKTRGLWLPIGLHFSWNYSLGFLYSLPVSGLRLEGVLWRVEVTDAMWLSGGGYGPEGSLLSTLIALAAIAVLARTPASTVSSNRPAAVE